MSFSSETVWIEGGEFRMGERFYLEERPVQRVAVDGVWIDEHPSRMESSLTSSPRRATSRSRSGHLTHLDPDASPQQLVPGSIVFLQPAHRVALDDWRQWWEWVPGASWRHPDGPANSLDGLEDHPVVHVAHEDAEAYARWAGKQLPPSTSFDALQPGADTARA